MHIYAHYLQMVIMKVMKCVKVGFKITTEAVLHVVLLQIYFFLTISIENSSMDIFVMYDIFHKRSVPLCFPPKTETSNPFMQPELSVLK